jgi:hypothetical protein
MGFNLGIPLVTHEKYREEELVQIKKLEEWPEK